jgi:hypothetical protein
MASNIADFRKQLGNFEADVKKKHVKFVLRVAEATHREAYLVTPIDTSRAMSGWVASVNVPFLNEPNHTPGSKGSTRAEAWRINEESIRVAAEAYKFGNTLHIRNNVPYIEILEGGGSPKQAPNGMMALALLAANAEMSR